MAKRRDHRSRGSQFGPALRTAPAGGGVRPSDAVDRGEVIKHRALSELPEAAFQCMTGWKPKIIQLRYSVSYVKLFVLNFRALEDVRPFDPHRPAVTDARPPIEVIPPEYDVVMERNQPLAAGMPVIQRLPNALRYAPHQMLHFYTDLRGGPDQAFKW